MATKKDVRDSIAISIVKVEAGLLKRKSTGEKVTLDTIPEETLAGWKARLAEKKISRKSIYSTIECLFIGPWSDNPTERESHMKNIHNFVYSKLDK